MKDLFKKFRVDDPFFNGYEQLIKEVVIPYQEQILHDQQDVGEKSQAIGNFELAAKKLESGAVDQDFYGMVFQDSDVAKWLEAAAYSLQLFPDPDLEKRCDDIIDLIGRAQWEDGYLNTYFTVKSPELRWTNLQLAHELYCAGHMMEAAVAYYDVTGKSVLLDIMSRMGEHIYQRFIVEKAEGYPGHPEVELALLRMYEATGNDHFKILADHFIDVRGVDTRFYDKEREKNDWSPWGNTAPANYAYSQAHEPVRDQKDAVGHAVRAVYLYAAMAEAALVNGDDELKESCQTLWKSIENKRMYVTGSIGSAYEGEAFTEDYHLPNDTAYAETCAAIGLIFFGRRMLELDTNSKYADVMERALYNSVLPGMQLDGTKFFYVNPLEAIPGISGKAVTHRHALPTRPNWFACACCPPNVARLLPSIGRYAWGLKDGTVFSHLFVGGELTIDDQDLQGVQGQEDNKGGVIKLESDLPFGKALRYVFKPHGHKMTMTLAIRMPYWSEHTIIHKDGHVVDCLVKDGYAYIQGDFTEDTLISVDFDLEAKMVYANPKIPSNSNKVAVMRGPLIYCAEGVDNGNRVINLNIMEDTPFETKESQDFKGVINLEAKGLVREISDDLYSFEKPEVKETVINLVPYYTWSNRGLGEMRVWLPYS